MNHKTRFIGAAAAVALSLSMATGVMAQSETTATLEDFEGGACAASISTATFNLGVWQWNGSQYVLDGEVGVDNATTGNIDVTQTISSQPVDCYVAASVSLLTGDNGGTIAANLLSTVLNPLAQPISTSTNAGENVALTVTLNSVGTPPEGVYTGTVTVTVSESAL